METTKITPADMVNFRDKASLDPKVLELYEQNEYLVAYAKHTDLRVQDNPQGAIGRVDEWESHGELQRDFLISHGMTPKSRVLDIGCGVGRAARKLAPYLDVGHYTGVDISPDALAYARALSGTEGWASREPRFELIEGTSVGVEGPFDIVWAHSVFTHLPEWAISQLVASIRQVMSSKGLFLFTYKETPKLNRSGLKQFQQSRAYFEQLAHANEFQFKKLDMVFPASQRTGRMKWGDTAKMSQLK
jgi:SAM-dependent methyltransferase